MAVAPVVAVSTEYPSSTKFCRRESAIVGSSSTTRIRTSLFSTFFSSLEMAAPWGIFGLLLLIISNCRLPISNLLVPACLQSRQSAIGNQEILKVEAQLQTSYP